MNIKTTIKGILPSPFKTYLNWKASLTNKVSWWNYVCFHMKRDKRVYWPVHKNSEVTHPDNIFVGFNSNPGTRPGCYIQGNGGIYIGNYVSFASNIGLISGNHNVYDQKKHDTADIYIDDYCWIGMGAIILPGVRLGKRTIVGAGSVVTKSFVDGFCVIAGNPARVIRYIDSSAFVPTTYPTEFYGYIPKEDFFEWSSKFLSHNKFLNKSK